MSLMDSGVEKGLKVRLTPKAMAIGLTVVLAGGLLVLMALGLINKSPVTGLSGVTRVGKPAPDITLPLLTGGEYALSESGGRPVVINFWSTWCPPCRQEARLLEAAWRSYRDQDVQFVGVMIQDTEANGRAYLKEFDITYPNGVDTGGRTTVDYGVIGLPVTFFVGRDGIVEGRWVGAIPEDKLLERTDRLMAGAVAPDDTEGQNLEAYQEFD